VEQKTEIWLSLRQFFGGEFLAGLGGIMPRCQPCTCRTVVVVVVVVFVVVNTAAVVTSCSILRTGLDKISCSEACSKVSFKNSQLFTTTHLKATELHLPYDKDEHAPPHPQLGRQLHD